jgi:hypothetical protein
VQAKPIAPPAAPWKLADELRALASLDTQYADLYVQRARELLAGTLGEAEYRALEQAQTDSELLQDRVRGAMQLGDWKQVQALAATQARMKARLQETAPVRAVAAAVYGFEGVLVDPFSPGLRALAGTGVALPAVRDEASRRLARLEAADPAWKALYAARREALAKAPIEAPGEAPTGGATTAVQLKAEAARALATSDFDRLQALSSKIIEAEAREAAAGPRAEHRVDENVPDLCFQFPAAVLERAGPLGLVHVHVESIRDQFLALYSQAWRPAEEGGPSSGTVRLSPALPEQPPEALRERLELFLDRPFVSSAGCRFLPWAVAEDALVEGFDEPVPGAPEPSPALLAALGLERRRGLSRVQLERALLERGVGVVVDLGLDPHRFRLVCIPPDLHLRAGRTRGWGSQPQWTHLDGYMVQQRKFLALAGGDVRFGGIYDMVGVGRNNDSPSLISRFAVVQRRRLAAW